MEIKKIIKSNKVLYSTLLSINNSIYNFKTSLKKINQSKFCFKFTHYYWKLRKLKNIHKGKRCFIIGNGPSLKVEDLDKLQNEITFASNKIFLMLDKTNWRPTYYGCADFSVGKYIIDDINIKLNTSEKFIPYKHDWFPDKNLIKGANRFYINYNNKSEFLQNFSEDISNEICCGGTITYILMQIAMYMGFKEIYLLGIDHNYSIYKDINGNIVKDNSIKDYFSNDYYDKGNQPHNIGNLGVSTISYETAKFYAKKRNVNIYNATRGGKLEVFTRKEFDSIFE